jgi:hypothetical protein
LITYAFDNAPRHSVEFEKKLISPAELPSFNHGICHFFYMENHPLARLISRTSITTIITFLGSAAVVTQRNETGCAEPGTARRMAINPSRIRGRKVRVLRCSVA